MNEQITLDDLRRLGASWMERIQGQEKAEKHWLDEAKDAEAYYLCDDQEITGSGLSFNILHSNVQTIVPAVYNSTPSPDIRPRHDNRDEAAKDFADALERAIATQIDDDRLDVEMEGLVQDMYLAGRGVVRVRFDADIYDTGMLANERVEYENVSWRDYRESPATRWQNVTWVAFRHKLSSDDIARLSDKEILDKYPDGSNEELDQDVWEIWCKETKRVLFVAEETCEVFSIQPDPLGLSGFFPMPAPAQSIHATGKRTPVCPFSVYKALAKEVDTATKRINKVMQGLKVRGAFAGDASIVRMINECEDNELVPIDNLKSLIAQGGLGDAVLWWPVEQSIAVMRELYAQRQTSIEAIYEVTGLSDILRGASDPRETMGAQEIKAEWGSVRVKRMQRTIQRTVRDLFVISAEIIASKFSVEGLARAAGMEVTPELAQMKGQLDHFRIDVESDSTIRANLTRRRGEMGEFLQASSAYMSTMAPIVEKSAAMAGPAAEIYGAFTRTFQLGKTVEDAIDHMTEMAREQAQQTAQEPTPEQKLEIAKIDLQKQEVQIAGEKARTEAMIAEARLQEAQASAARAEAQVKIEATKAMYDIARQEKELGLKVDAQALAREKASVEAMMNAEELELEREQQRPVGIGDGHF
jgi:hypothetical protein